MLGTHSFVTPVAGVLTRLRDWPVTAQHQARRNAMVAATACAQRRIEREDVDDFLRHHDRHVGEVSAGLDEVSAGLDEASARLGEASSGRERPAARAHG